MINFKRCAERYETELRTSVIPFWENHCVDREFGGYFTSLDRDGSVYDTTKYMWMQWRIVYMFSELYLAAFFRHRRFHHYFFILPAAREGWRFFSVKKRFPA